MKELLDTTLRLPRRELLWRLAFFPCLLVCLVGFLLLPSVVNAAVGEVPRLANGKPDFSGLWQTTSAADYDLEPHATRRDAPPGPGVVEGGLIPYLPQKRPVLSAPVLVH